MPDVLGAMRTHLISEGIVRKPTTAGALPPLWLEPLQGVPAPGETMPRGGATEVGATVVAAAFLGSSEAPGPYESSWRKPTVDVWIRAADALSGRVLEEAITGALIDRREWMMGPLLVIESQVWRGLQPLPQGANALATVGSRPTHDWLVSYEFQVLAD